MIQVNELRIGNLISWGGCDFTVEQISRNELSLKEYSERGGVIFTSENYNPILLTEEWLLRLGFNRFCKDFSKKVVVVHTRKRGFIIKKSIPQINSVHQLQNLYFAFTGTELILKQ